ncbi:hypothetical protein AXK57_00775 [Tsukamurella pulmonis]|uniref:DUF3592 domain-containing protein n=1 Tax=Tsukamurella pulmonis TaxID=47312 RepID=UPI000799940C|nr:DUF3592 domain-containing protein [Tsukamurella pulmonis]KXP12821.1 hypothetical protein AXK57_00775 [Tsukamurella pulmonis]
MSRTALRRVQIVLLCAAILITGLCVVLVAAAVRDDRTIDADRGTATAEVLSAGPRRSTISFYTTDGVNHNPPLGVLYPSELNVGDRIQVEYSRSDPELVRVAGRSAAVAVLPAASVAAGTWLVVGVIMVLIAAGYHRGESSPDVPRTVDR